MDEQETPRWPYMRLWIDDIRGSCQDMSAAQFGAHMRMLMHSWERGSVSANERKLRRIVGEIDWDEMADVIERWDVGADGTMTHPRLERERAKMVQEHERKARAGKAGGQARAKQNSSRTVSEDVTDDAAQIKQSHIPIPHIPIPHIPNNPTPQLSSIRSDECFAPSKRTRTRPQDPLSWSEETGWVGITDADHAKWQELFPAVKVEYELKRLDQWLRDFPAKAKKRFWRRWLNKLFAVKQDEGGTRGHGNRGSAPQRTRVHIAADAHPDYEHEWFMPNGFTPRYPLFYHDITGREKENGGGYVDEAPSQGDTDENDQ